MNVREPVKVETEIEARKLKALVVYMSVFVVLLFGLGPSS